MNDEILHVDNLSIGYQQPICSGIFARVKKGELVGLTGKNGSGKSTLIKSLLGLQPLHSGSVFMNSENINGWDVQKRSKEIAVVFSRLNQVPVLSVFDLVSLGRLPYSNGFSKVRKEEKDQIHASLELVGITDLKNKMANQLSDGQLQMAMIARALVQDTDLIIMDEPTSHLDIENQFKIFELIYKLAKETGKTFIVASHQVELVLQNATQLWWIDQGEFHAGFPEQVAYEQRIFEKLSQNQIKFNYQTGSFQFLHSQTKSVHFTDDGSDLSYWVKHALKRNGYAFIEDSKIKIKVHNRKIQLNSTNFESIESLLYYLEIR